MFTYQVWILGAIHISIVLPHSCWSFPEPENTRVRGHWSNEMFVRCYHLLLTVHDQSTIRHYKWTLWIINHESIQSIHFRNHFESSPTCCRSGTFRAGGLCIFLSTSFRPLADRAPSGPFAWTAVAGVQNCGASPSPWGVQAWAFLKIESPKVMKLDWMSWFTTINGETGTMWWFYRGCN